MKILRVSAFSYQNLGGNPAGVVVCEEMPEAHEMLRVAKQVGYSETAFLEPCSGGWRVRYFAPEMEVPFCGHATIAAGYVLGRLQGAGKYELFLNEGSVEVTIDHSDPNAVFVSLQSPKTSSTPAPSAYVARMLSVLGLASSDLKSEFPVRFAAAGAKHLILLLNERETLSSLTYDFDALKAIMAEQALVTVNVLYQATNERFHSRNPFPPGGVYEDPATGAAAAAFAGYLRDIGWQASADFEVLQGEDMGQPSRLLVSYDAELGSSVRVSGEARELDAG